MLAGDNQAALSAVLIASIVVPLAVLGVVLWFMQRSWKRHEAENARQQSEEG